MNDFMQKKNEPERLNKNWDHPIKGILFLKVDPINGYVFDRIHQFVNEIQLSIHGSLRRCDGRIHRSWCAYHVYIFRCTLARAGSFSFLVKTFLNIPVLICSKHK